MTKRYWAVGAILATVLTNTGCVTHCHRGYQKSLVQGADNDVPSPCRNRVHVFMMHGLTPSTECGLNTLRLKLGENGFAKVGMGEVCSGLWVKNEIECVRFNDPDARFVLLGYDLGGATAISLARDLAAKGAHIDAVVLLDPMGCPAEPCGIRTLLLTSGTSTSRVPYSSRIVVPDASHFGLPAHPTTVAAVTELLKDVALLDCQPPVDEVPVWTYPHAPEARRIPVRAAGGEWDFLADRPGGPTPIGTHVVTHPPQPTPATAAGPVVLKR